MALNYSRITSKYKTFNSWGFISALSTSCNQATQTQEFANRQTEFSILKLLAFSSFQ